jgi:hypothetical protein
MAALTTTITTTTTTSRRDRLEAAWRAERAFALDARASGDLEAEWRHLERAHILSQPIIRLHVATHVAMLGAALRRRNPSETVGQVVRLVLAAPGSATGKYPKGNTGGANVSAFRPMPVPSDLRPLLEEVGK